MRKHRIEMALAITLAAGLAVTIVWGMRSSPQDRTIVVTGGLMAMLGVVTTIYAWSTTEQAEASRTMAEEMKQQRTDAVRPVLVIGGTGGLNRFVDSEIKINPSKKDRLQMLITNVGKGPALNITVKNIDHVPPLGEGYSTTVVANFKGQELIKIPELTFELKYFDIYGNRKGTAQKLRLSDDTNSYLVMETRVN